MPNATGEAPHPLTPSPTPSLPRRERGKPKRREGAPSPGGWEGVGEGRGEGLGGGVVVPLARVPGLQEGTEIKGTWHDT